MSTVLITGANRGIGLELAKVYAEGGHTVLACCRNPSEAKDLGAVEGDVEIYALDVDDADAVAGLATELGGRPVDILVNNAGIMGPKPEQQTARTMDFDGWAKTFSVNSMAPVRMMHALMDNLNQSDDAKVVNITSQLGALSLDMPMGYAYSASKAALNKYMKLAAGELASDGIHVCVIHPGWVQTDMGGKEADITPRESAEGIAQTVEKLNAETTGSFWKWNGEEHDW